MKNKDDGPNYEADEELEKYELMELLCRFGVGYQLHTDSEFIMEEALEAGAIETICLRGEVDLAFDKDGRCVGSYTNASRSWRKRLYGESCEKHSPELIRQAKNTNPRKIVPRKITEEGVSYGWAQNDEHEDVF